MDKCRWSDFLMISTSSGDGKSYIYRAPRANLSLTQTPIADRTLTFPARGEDLSFDNDQNFCTQSESGAKYSQKLTSPWGTFYPFLFKISSFPNHANGQVQIILNLNSNCTSVLRGVNVLGQV